MIQSAFLNILTTSLKMSFFILPLILLSPMLERKYSAKWNYYIWLGVAVYLLIPVPLAFSKAPIQIQTTQILQAVSPKNGIPLLAGTLQNELQQTVATALSADSMLSPINIAAAIWILGAVLFFLFHVLAYLQYTMHIKRWCYSATDSQLALFKKVKSDLKITRKVSLLCCPKTKSPMLLGFFSPSVIITPNAYDSTDLYLILKHELIHLDRNDIPAKIVMFFSQTIHWFNPLVHLMASKWHQIIEMSCDEHVISGDDVILSERYMNTIIHSIEHSHEINNIFTTHYFGGIKVMKKRLENIARNKNNQKGRLALLAVLLLCIVLSTLIAFNTGMLGKGKDVVTAAKPTTSNVTETPKPNSVQTNATTVAPLGKNIKNLLAESKADAKLEKMIIAELEIPDEYLAQTSYFYNYVDLNQDGNKEVFVVVMGPYTGGTGGDTAIIALPSDTGYNINQVFTLIQTPVIISDKITNGCHEIVVMNSGGGAEGNYVSLTASDGYYQTVNDGTVVKDIDSISGTAIIANDLIKDFTNGTTLKLSK